ncbi:acyl-CoA dehydrogenase family protein [[Mycobacterium] burgundiense]|uniref:Acyl-CoA dehydrogenase family protein n=1 Tax=[Mycobacterium] burgundiense TaxID=3064286 RepID=A0ABM9LJZ7_9MYCO|nr:acyl-CoA dehydrogenase family protein [Mycolicibacterium sp. MU0053]CAJ1500378.1 acyl-CoA dehydrogenase family protein [Mycolicibacterium sp. MU0053]
MPDGLDILREIGRAAAPVPAGETDLLGDWLLRQADLPAVPELLAVAQGNTADDLRLHRDGDRVMLSGTADRVAWAARSGRFVGLVSDEDANYVVCVPIERLTITPGTSLAGESRDMVTARAVALDTNEIGAAPQLDLIDLRARGAATRAVLIQGAVEAVVELVRDYCEVRTQFGRRLRDFQVVGHQLALMREHATLVSAAAELASAVLQGSGSWEDAATAKIVAGEVAGHIAKAAHQLHGAIGVSEEYVLHRYTRRLWAWRDEYGSENEWAHRLGATLVQRGPDALWPWVAAAADQGG